MKATVGFILFSLLAQVAFPQQKGGFGKVYNDDLEQVQDISKWRANSQNKALKDYILEMFPGHNFTGWYYFWSTSGISVSSLVEDPEVPWLSISPTSFTSVSCAEIIPVKFSFITPSIEGVYETTIIDNSGNWDPLRVSLTVTKSPEKFSDRKIGINQNSMSYKSYFRYSPVIISETTFCVTDYFPGDTMSFGCYFNPVKDWLSISPESGKIFRNAKQDLQNTLHRKTIDSTWVVLERSYYSLPAIYHYVVRETEPLGYSLQFNGSNLITTGYSPNSSTKTLMYWVRFDEIADQSIGSHDYENHRFYLGIDSDNSLFAGMGDNYAPVTSLNLLPGEWHHMALTTSKDMDSAIVYIDAVEVSRWKYSFSGESKASLYFGARNDINATSSPVKGLIDEVQVWERPLSRSEIATYMYSPPVGTENGLIIYYPFNEGWGNFTKNAVDTYYYGLLYYDPQWISNIKRPDAPGEISEIKVPGGLTPYGQFDNRLIITGLGNYPNNKLKIFNRYGTLVFEEAPYQNEWDGIPNVGRGITEADGRLPSGTYFYILEPEPGKDPLTGYIYLIKN